MGKNKRGGIGRALKIWICASLVIGFALVLLDPEKNKQQSPQTPDIRADKGVFISPMSFADYKKIHNDWGKGDTGQATALAENMTARNYYVVLDTSGSMNETDCGSGGETKMQVARESLKKWAGTLHPDDNLGLASFSDDGVKEVFPLQKNLPSYNKQFTERLATLYPGGGTPLGVSLAQAYETMTRQADSQLGYGEYHIVVVTDGKASDHSIMKKAVDKIYKSPVILHTIGFCIDSNHALNRPGFSYYVSAMNQEELDRGLQQVLAESETFDITGFTEAN